MMLYLVMFSHHYLSNVGAVYVGASMNLTGNVLPTGAVRNSLNVNGNTALGLTGAI
jgi:hypothetical protein